MFRRRPRFDRRGLVARKSTAVRSLLDWFTEHIRRFFRNTSAVEETSQSAATELYERLGSRREVSTSELERWAVYSVNNALRRSLRQFKRRVVAYDEEAHELRLSEELFTLRLALERMEIVISLLPVEQQRALLAKIEGYTNAEIAKELETTPDAVRSSVARARATLREELSGKLRRQRLIRCIEEIKRQHDLRLPVDLDRARRGRG